MPPGRAVALRQATRTAVGWFMAAAQSENSVTPQRLTLEAVKPLWAQFHVVPWPV